MRGYKGGVRTKLRAVAKDPKKSAKSGKGAEDRLMSILSHDIKEQIRLMGQEEKELLYDSELSTKIKNSFDLQNNSELLIDCKAENANDAATVMILALWWKLKIIA